MENQLNASTVAKRRSNTDSKIFQKQNKLKPVVESDKKIAIDEKFKLIYLEDGKYYIPCYSKIEVKDEKKGGLLLLMDAELGGFKNIIVGYKYVRQFRKLLENYEPYQICVSVIEDRFTHTSGHNAGKTIVFNKLEFSVYENGALEELSKILPHKEFVYEIDEETADEIVEKVYNEDKKVEDYFSIWYSKIDKKEELIEEKIKKKKKRAAQNHYSEK